MGIDIRTVSLILGITHLIQVLVFFYQYKINKNIKGPGWWLLWSATESLAFVLIFLRNNPSLQHFVIIFQSILILSGAIFVYIGTLLFFDRKVNLKLIVPLFLVFLITHFYFIFFNDNITIRSINISAFLSLFSFLTAITIFKHKKSSINLTANFNTIIFIVHGCIFAYRTIMICLGTQVTDVFSPTLFNFIPYFDALIVSLLWTFGFIMMLNQSLNSEINDAKTHFEQIFNTNPDAAVISRLNDGLLIQCNESFEKISGYAKEDISGVSSLDIKLWKNPHDRLELIRMISEKGFCENFESLFQRKNGQVFTGLLSAKILTLKGIPHLISVTRDITERKQIEEEIKFKNKELKNLNAEKDKFFSIIAHDLKGPFNGFLGLTQVMAEQLPSLTLAEVQKIAVSMSNSANNLYHLLENLLEWSQIQKGAFPFNPEVIQLGIVVRNSIDMILESAKLKNIEISHHVADGLLAVADMNMIQTVIRNLAFNAIKFTPKGGKISILAKTKADNNLEISIQDTGIGMSRDMIENLFRIDVQTNRKGTEGELSTGLGLLLCKEFTEKNGGKIWVESAEANLSPGKAGGSTFYFTLPIYIPPETESNNRIEILNPEKEVQINPEVSGLKILIAEDDETSSKLISIHVLKFGNEIIIVKTGKEAVEVCRTNPDIDLILMDIQMPEMNGYEATRQIRQFNSDVLIIALTAYALAGDRKKALESGCTDYISKPIRKDKLMALIQKHFKKNEK